MNFQFSLPRWNVTEETGYEPKTTFWQDFWIAVPFGQEAVIDTYNRAKDGWRDNEVYIAELSLVLNHIGWALYNRPDQKQLSKIFFDLQRELEEWVFKNFNSEQLGYFLNITN